MNPLVMLVALVGLLGDTVHGSGEPHLLVVSGYSNGSQVNVAEKVNLDGDYQIKPLANYPINVEGAVGTQINETAALVCGGLQATGSNLDTFDTCYIYNADTNTWANTAPKFSLSPRVFPWTLELNATAWWVTGGSKSGYNDLVATTEILNKQTLGFEPGLDLPEAMNDHCLSRVNQTHVMLVGGKATSDRYSNRTFMLNLNSMTWTEMARLTNGRMGLACGTFVNAEGKLSVFAAGGYLTGFVPTDTVELFDVVANQWSSGPALPQAVAFGVIAQERYLVGGVNSDGELDTIYQFETSNATWSLWPKRLTRPRSAPAVILMNGSTGLAALAPLAYALGATVAYLKLGR